MELNHDCVRHLLLEIEANKKLGKPLTEHNFAHNYIFKNYDFDTIMYALLKLKEAGYINVSLRWSEGEIYDWLINDITWAGHEFLDNIRDDKTWKYVKDVAKKTSSMSVSLMGKLAFKYLSEQFNLT